MIKHLVFALVSLSIWNSASAVTVDWTWTGRIGDSASGSFSYADSLAGTGVIYAGSYDTFSIEGSYLGAPILSWNLTDGTTDPTWPLIFAFDTTAFDIVKGGVVPSDPDSVVIGDHGSIGALICGSGSCGFDNVPGVPFGGRPVGEDQFTFTRVASGVPEPATLALFGLGALGFAVGRRRATA